MTSRIAFRCDAGPTIGVGHVMRCLALAEELRDRGLEPVFFSDTPSVPWLEQQLADRGLANRVPSEADAAALLAFDPAAVVFDSYLLAADVYRAVREAGVPTVAIVDGELRGAEADLYVDQNAGAELDEVALPLGARRLAGIGYALVRGDVLAMRPQRAPVARETSAPEVLAVFGGTDALGAGPDLVRALAATGRSFHATVVVPRTELRERIDEVDLGPGQRVTPIEPSDQLAQLARASDLVVSAAGSSTWELLALGVCSALVCVADNQRNGYLRLVESEVAARLGELSDLRRDPQRAVLVLKDLLAQPAARAKLANAAWRAVDGEGRSRVADELSALLP